MINTRAFESLKRYEELHVQLEPLVRDPRAHPYHWMIEPLIAAIKREIAFMEANREEWEKELEEIGKYD